MKEDTEDTTPPELSAEVSKTIRRLVYTIGAVMVSLVLGWLMGGGCSSSARIDVGQPSSEIVHSPITESERVAVSNMVVAILATSPTVSEDWEGGVKTEIQYQAAFATASETICPPRTWRLEWVLREGIQ